MSKRTSDRPCNVTGCPALAANGSIWCAPHRAMTEAERADAIRDGERRNFKPQRLVRVTDRIEYEKP